MLCEKSVAGGQRLGFFEHQRLWMCVTGRQGTATMSAPNRRIPT
jgi:hypothetical protein